jgi:hypothetical protein
MFRVPTIVEPPLADWNEQPVTFTSWSNVEPKASSWLLRTI